METIKIIKPFYKKDDLKFEEYKEKLLKDGEAVFDFENYYEASDFSNYLNNNKIYHTNTPLGRRGDVSTSKFCWLKYW